MNSAATIPSAVRLSTRIVEAPPRPNLECRSIRRTTGSSTSAEKTARKSVSNVEAIEMNAPNTRTNAATTSTVRVVRLTFRARRDSG